MSRKITARKRVVGVTTDFETLPLDVLIYTRNPGTHDEAEIGQTWVNEATNIAFMCTGRNGQSYVWVQQANAAVALNVGGLLTAESLAVTHASTLTGGCTIGTSLTVSAGGAAVTGNSSVAGSFQSTTMTCTNDFTITTATKGIVLPGTPKIVTNAGAPGALVAPKGSLCIDYTNGKLYVMGAAWELVTSA